VHEATYLEDARLRRLAYFDWLTSPHTGYDAYFAIPAAVMAVVLVLLAQEWWSFFLGACLIGSAAAKWFQFAALGQTTPVEVPVRADAESFELSSPHVEAHLPWRDVRKVYITRRFLWLVTGSARVDVPKSALRPDGVTFVVDSAEEAGASLHGWL
jgi:hypothetical protein